MATAITALQGLLDWLYTHYGPWGPVVGPVAAVAFFGVSLWLRNRRAHTAATEQEKALQRMANEAREYRIFFFKKIGGWDDEQIERYIMRNEHPDGASTRRALEEGRPGSESGMPTKRPGTRRKR